MDSTAGSRRWQSRFRWVWLVLAFCLLCPGENVAAVSGPEDKIQNSTAERPDRQGEGDPWGKTVLSTDAERNADERARLAILESAGFPTSYAEALLPLTYLHPNWTFEAVAVPETWERVLDLETEEEPARNLISSGAAYTAYRHAENTELYDSGYYQASRETVAYFMDPRHFFNETDIFQFYSLKRAADLNLSEDDRLAIRVAVETIVAGTFMAGQMPDSDMTYVQAFLAAGDDVGVDPIYLAVKARQEQGLRGSPTVGGRVGDRLRELEPEREDGDLARYNGLYNIYNIGAGGKGTYDILRSAMERAAKGSPDYAEEWGGAAWNTVYRSVVGGAAVMKTRYVDNAQTTFYFQKFNVHPDSGRRFWGQYMQNVVGALSEGRTLAAAFTAGEGQDGPCHFVIPVYRDMPATPSPDPAKGSCRYTMPSDQTYTCRVRAMIGEEEIAAEGEAFLSAVCRTGTEAILRIHVATDADPERWEWSRQDPAGEEEGGSLFRETTGWQEIRAVQDGETGEFFLELPIEPASWGLEVNRSAMLVVRGILRQGGNARCRSVTVCRLWITRTEETGWVRYYVDDTLWREVAVSSQKEERFPTVTSPSGEAEGRQWIGWLRVNGGASEGTENTLYPAGAEVPFPDGEFAIRGEPGAEYRAVFARISVLPGAALGMTEEGGALFFTATLDRKSEDILSRFLPEQAWKLELVGESVSSRDGDASDDDSGVALPGDLGQTREAEQILIPVSRRTSRGGKDTEWTARTPVLTDRDQLWEATALLTITYGDGRVQTFSACLPAATGQRSGRQVALAALADREVEYTPEMRRFLRSFME